jgi:aminoglycoside/choline kinase family phosphotransferase
VTDAQTRHTQFENWLKANLPNEQVNLLALPGDASFRHYFRLEGHPGWLAVDAPPEHEKTIEFVRVAEAYAALGVHVPQIMAYNTSLGFLIVSDLGEMSYLQALKAHPGKADGLYQDALTSLIQITRCEPSSALPLERFDATFMNNELQFFTQWFLKDYLKINVTAGVQSLLDKTYGQLIQQAEAQQQVCIHRDYHSRNLIVCESGKNPGVIDFQDAMIGPITYDCVSLLRDAYISWPADQVTTLSRFFYDQLRGTHHEYQESFDRFYHDFQWMGMQRHLKAIFIFARKYLRDQNPNYLGDIPRTLNYVRQVAKGYSAFHTFSDFIETDVVPHVRGLE